MAKNILGVMGMVVFSAWREMCSPLFLRKFSNLGYKFLLRAFGVSAVSVNYFSARVAHYHKRYHLTAERPAEVAVDVKQHFVGPFMQVNQWLHLVCVLRFVNRHGIERDAGLCLPVLIYFGNGGKLTYAGLALCCKKAYNKRTPLAGESRRVDCFTTDVLKSV